MRGCGNSALRDEQKESIFSSANVCESVMDSVGMRDDVVFPLY